MNSLLDQETLDKMQEQLRQHIDRANTSVLYPQPMRKVFARLLEVEDQAEAASDAALSVLNAAMELRKTFEDLLEKYPELREGD